MQIKATLEELTTYARLHQDYVLQSKPDVMLEAFEREVQFDPNNNEHQAAKGSFNQFLAFKRKKSGAVADLSGLTLEGLDLSNLDLTGVILAGSTILGCVFNHSVLRGIDLTRATVKENLFASASIDIPKHNNAQIIGNDFSNASFSRKTFSGAEEGKKLSQGNTGLNF